MPGVHTAPNEDLGSAVLRQLSESSSLRSCDRQRKQYKVLFSAKAECIALPAILQEAKGRAALWTGASACEICIFIPLLSILRAGTGG